MILRTNVRFAAVLTMLCFGVTEGYAETNLFDLLFGGNNKSSRSRVLKVQKPQKKRIVVRRARIKGPSYYTYRADPMTKVNFAPVIAAKAEMSLQPVLNDDYFDDAVASLAGYNLRADKQIAAALAEYYSHNRAFIWISGFHPNGKAAAALSVLNDADNWGLAAVDYSVESPTGSFSLDDMPARLGELMRFEMALSAKVLRYAHDARQGKVDPNRISGYHDLPRKDLNLASVLDALAETENAEEFLTAQHPSNDQFKILRKELITLRQQGEEDVAIDLTAFVRPNTSHPEFPRILAAITKHATPEFLDKYEELLAQHKDSQSYTPELIGLIKAAQRQHRTGADGIIGRRTIAALNGDSQTGRLDRVLLAMERLRWLPSKLGETHVLINQPDYRVTFRSEGREPLSMRVVVGKNANQTSFFQDEIEQVVYNPYWGVPQSIIVNEMIPRLIRDPGYLDRAGYEVTDVRGKKISSRAVNWGAYGSRVPFDVRQKPSPRNALGELKILFPNKHAIYMHDTPSKNLFQRDKRAFSHGCVRLEKPREMAAAVLGVSTGEIAQKLKQGHSSQDVPVRIPIYIAYFTAWPNEAGTVSYFEDVYGRDTHLKKAMAKVETARKAGRAIQ